MQLQIATNIVDFSPELGDPLDLPLSRPMARRGPMTSTGDPSLQCCRRDVQSRKQYSRCACPAIPRNSEGHRERTTLFAEDHRVGENVAGKGGQSAAGQGSQNMQSSWQWWSLLWTGHFVFFVQHRNAVVHL